MVVNELTELEYELENPKVQRINIRVSSNLLKELHIVKRKTGVTISEMIRRGLRDYLNNQLSYLDE